MKTGMIVLVAVLLGGCHSAYDLGGGKWMVTQATEQRSPGGTNMGFSRVAICDGPKERTSFGSPFWGAEDYQNCEAKSEWIASSSQGQGGQVAAGALIGVGIGAAGAVMGGSSATSSSLATQSIVVPAVKGHH